MGFTPCGGNAGRHVHFTVLTIDRDTLAARNLPTVNGDYEPYADTFRAA